MLLSSLSLPSSIGAVVSVKDWGHGAVCNRVFQSGIGSAISQTSMNRHSLDGAKSPLKYLAEFPDARNERHWFHIFVPKLDYENPTVGDACRDMVR